LDQCEMDLSAATRRCVARRLEEASPRLRAGRQCGSSPRPHQGRRARRSESGHRPLRRAAYSSQFDRDVACKPESARLDSGRDHIGAGHAAGKFRHRHQDHREAARRGWSRAQHPMPDELAPYSGDIYGDGGSLRFASGQCARETRRDSEASLAVRVDRGLGRYMKIRLPYFGLRLYLMKVASLLSAGLEVYRSKRPSRPTSIDSRRS